jgi:CheY-like chemotaxis protein
MEQASYAMGSRNIPGNGPHHGSDEIQGMDQGRSRMRILIVDDNPGVLQVASSAVEFMGHEVDTAKDGIDAVDRLANGRYDIVITDAEMPKLDGIGLCRFIRSHFRNVRIIGMSGTEIWEEFKEAGADTFFSKPFGLKQLQDAVENPSRPIP